MISLEYKRPLTELADFHNHRSEWLNMDNWIVHSHDDEPHNCGKPKREHIRTVTRNNSAFSTVVFTAFNRYTTLWRFRATRILVREFFSLQS